MVVTECVGGTSLLTIGQSRSRSAVDDVVIASNQVFDPFELDVFPHPGLKARAQYRTVWRLTAASRLLKMAVRCAATKSTGLCVGF